MKHKAFVELRVGIWVVLVAVTALLVAGLAWQLIPPSGSALSQVEHEVELDEHTQEEHSHGDEAANTKVTLILGEFFFQVEGQELGEPLVLKAGDRVAMEIKNAGQILHEAQFGININADGHGYADKLLKNLTVLLLDAGNSVNIEFEIPEQYRGLELEIGCFVPGHYQAGMKLPLIIK